MKLLDNLKIDIQRWIFRRKVRQAKRRDHDKMMKAIVEANAMSEKVNKRFWVIKLAVSEYGVFTKQQARAFFRRLNMNVNYMQTNEYIVHITNKPAA